MIFNALLSLDSSTVAVCFVLGLHVFKLCMKCLCVQPSNACRKGDTDVLHTCIRPQSHYIWNAGLMLPGPRKSIMFTQVTPIVRSLAIPFLKQLGLFCEA